MKSSMEDSLQTYVITLPTLKAEVLFSVPKLEKRKKRLVTFL